MSMIQGKQALIEILRQEKVEYVFGIPGATEVVFMDALQDAPDIRFILALQETGAAGLAEGYARISGKPAFLNFHTNTGLGAALPLLTNAFQGGVPLVITAGQQDTRLAAQDPPLKANLAGIASPVAKWATEIVNAEDIPLVMRQAFKIAQQTPTGPVFVALPQNLLLKDIEFEYTPGKLQNDRLQTAPQAINAAAMLLSKAQKPLMLVEDGVSKYQSLKEVTQLAESIGAGVYQQWMSDVNFPLDHPLYLGDLDVNSVKTRSIFEDADVLVVVGSYFFSQAVYTNLPLIPLGLKIIQIDNDPHQLGKNYPVDAALGGDIKGSLRALVAALKPLMKSQNQKVQARIKSIGVQSAKITTDFSKMSKSRFKDTPISAYRLMREIQSVVQPGTIIVDDCWSNSAILRQTFRFNTAESYLRSRGGGSIGFGLPGAIGVKLAAPDKPVVCVSGDGSAAWSIQSLWSAAHYEIPLTFIICANSAYRQVRIMKGKIMGDSVKGRNLGTELVEPRMDFCSLAAGFGVTAKKVEDPDQLSAVLSQSINSQQPNLVEVIIGQD